MSCEGWDRNFGLTSVPPFPNIPPMLGPLPITKPPLALSVSKVVSCLYMI